MKHVAFGPHCFPDETQSLAIGHRRWVLVMDDEGAELLSTSLRRAVDDIGTHLDQHSHAAKTGSFIYTDDERDALLREAEQIEEVIRSLSPAYNDSE